MAWIVFLSFWVFLQSTVSNRKSVSSLEEILNQLIFLKTWNCELDKKNYQTYKIIHVWGCFLPLCQFFHPQITKSPSVRNFWFVWIWFCLKFSVQCLGMQQYWGAEMIAGHNLVLSADQPLSCQAKGKLLALNQNILTLALINTGPWFLA